MAGLLNHLRQHFDHILIDSPPMLQVPDARVLAALGDGMVLVLRASRTTRDQLELAHARLVADRTPVIGAILNDWNPDTRSFRTYYSSNHKYAGKEE